MEMTPKHKIPYGNQIKCPCIIKNIKIEILPYDKQIEVGQIETGETRAKNGIWIMKNVIMITNIFEPLF